MTYEKPIANWLAAINAAPEASADVRKTAAALAQCLPPDGEYAGLGGGGVYADEFLFQLADDVTKLGAITAALYWLADHGHLDILAWTADHKSSFLMCRPIPLS